ASADHDAAIWVITLAGMCSDTPVRDRRLLRARSRLRIGAEGLGGVGHTHLGCQPTRAVDGVDMRCPCGGRLRFLARVTAPSCYRTILTSMGLDSSTPARAPPRQRRLLDWE